MSIRLVRGFLKNISVLIYDISTLSYDTCTGFADWHLERSSSSWATSTREKFLSKHCCVLRMRAHTSWTVDRASQKVRENSKFSSPDSDHHYNVQRLCFSGKRKIGNCYQMWFFSEILNFNSQNSTIFDCCLCKLMPVLEWPFQELSNAVSEMPLSNQLFFFSSKTAKYF